MLHDFPSSLMRGVSGDDPEGGAGSGVPRLAARNRSPRKAGDPARQALRPGCEELAVRIGRKCPRWKRGPGPKSPRVERREARVPPALRDARRLASAPVCRVTAHQPVPRKHLNIELDQMDSCKTAHNGLQRHQRVVAHLQNRSCNSERFRTLPRAVETLQQKLRAAACVRKH